MMRNIMRVGALIPLAALLMGNQSCQQQQTPARELKKIVNVGAISASNIAIPGAGTFDFKSVAQQQIYVAFSQSDGFATFYLPQMASTGDVVTAQNNMSSTDQALMNSASGNGQNTVKTSWSKEASCMVNLPMASVNTAINSFEIIGGGGITLGYSPSGPLTPQLGSLSFQLQEAQLDLTMMAIQPLSNSVMEAVDIHADQTKVNLSATINLGLLSIGPSGFYQTPLADVTMNALNKGVAAVKSSLEQTDWYSRVLENDDFTLTVIGGENVNLKEGDELVVYNESYYWTGEPCASTYVGGVAVSPVAVIKLIGVGDTLSIGQVIMRADENAVVGAKVKLYKLAESATPVPGEDITGLVNVQPVTPPAPVATTTSK